tara:strand:- start:635 stop:997 length:363 start_codon:yes stop_codon:yes gene_type:complete
MADGFKILAQATLTNTEAAVYAVPLSSSGQFSSRDISQAIISSIILCCTTGASASSYSIRVKKSGEADNNKQIIFNDKVILEDETDVLSLGIGLVSGDSIEASCSSGHVIQMSIFGTEVV